MSSNQPTCPCCGSEVSPLDLLIDEHEGNIVYNGAAARLTRQEFRLFQAIMNAYPRPLVKDDCLLAISDPADPEAGPEPKIIDVMICKMRKKLDPLGLNLTTLWGVGWSLQLDETGRAALLRDRHFRGTRHKRIAESGDIAMVAMYRAQGYPLTDIARRTNLTFKAVTVAIDTLEAIEATKRQQAAIGRAA